MEELPYCMDLLLEGKKELTGEVEQVRVLFLGGMCISGCKLEWLKSHRTSAEDFTGRKNCVHMKQLQHTGTGDV